MFGLDDAFFEVPAYMLNLDQLSKPECEIYVLLR